MKMQKKGNSKGPKMNRMKNWMFLQKNQIRKKLHTHTQKNLGTHVSPPKK